MARQNAISDRLPVAHSKVLCLHRVKMRDRGDMGDRPLDDPLALGLRQKGPSPFKLVAQIPADITDDPTS